MDFLPVLRHLLITLGLGTGPLKKQVESLEALCKVVRYLAKQPKRDGAEQLEALIINHIKLFKLAYPSEILTPKYHMALHLPIFLQQSGCLYSAFVQERKHKAFKQFATASTIDKNFEKAVLLDLLQHHMRLLQEPEHFMEGSYPTGPKVANASLNQTLKLDFPALGVMELVLAKGAACNMLHIHIGDLVFYKDLQGQRQLGKVKLLLEACTAEQKVIYGLLECYTLVRPLTWRPSALQALVQLGDIKATAIWSASAEGICALEV